MAPYGRILNSNEPEQGRCGTSGFLGPRTEQFALGSLYYLINYGYEVYGDRRLTDDPKEHGRKVVDLLQNMEFPKLDGFPLVDDIIHKCWHNKFATIAELAAYTETLLPERTKGKESKAKAVPIPRWRMATGCVIRWLWSTFRYWCAIVLCRNSETIKTEIVNSGEPNDHLCVLDQNYPAEVFSSKRAYCQGLEKRGLLDILSSGEPEQLGFTLEWYRHISSGY